MTTLRFISYLAPSLPEQLFVTVADYVGAALGLPTAVRFETRFSGPPPDVVDPFSSGEVDIGFLCSPGYLRLADLRPPAVRLLPAAPVFGDPRARGRPIYFSDVIVGQDSAASTFDDLGGASWAFNDPCSLSGYLSLLRRIRRSRDGFFGTLRQSGTHLESIRLVATGEADGAAIDSNVLALALRDDAGLARRVRILDSWGPYPIQPIVASATLSTALAARITSALLRLHHEPAWRQKLAQHRLVGFSAVSDLDYEAEREALRACGPSPVGTTAVDAAREALGLV